jgi:D-amino-acid oxidase
MDALVIGSGVIGLTSAIALAEAGAKVRIVTAKLPHETTSHAAGAMWGSTFAGPADRVRRWAEVSRDELRAQADDPRTGVRIARGMLVARTSSEGPPAFLFPGVRITRRNGAPDGYQAAFSLDVPVVDMPRYLDWLLSRFESAGGSVEVRTVRALADVAGEAGAIVNCTGIGARHLVPDAELRPVRGQHVIVENPGLDEFFMEEPGPRWASWMPHGDHVVLGGNADDGQWSLEPDLAVADEIVRRCAQIEPRLGEARVIEHRVGLRPARANVRLEAEPLGGATCVHNYGHGGTGVGLAWGCAREVAAMLARQG